MYTPPPYPLRSQLKQAWNTPKTWFICFSHVKMEKAEILEKTIIYIKKLQEITGKQDQGSESKIDDRQLPNQGTVIIAAFSRRKLSLFFLLSLVLIFPWILSSMPFDFKILINCLTFRLNFIWLINIAVILSYHPLNLCVSAQRNIPREVLLAT